MKKDKYWLFTTIDLIEREVGALDEWSANHDDLLNNEWHEINEALINLKEKVSELNKNEKLE